MPRCRKSTLFLNCMKRRGRVGRTRRSSTVSLRCYGNTKGSIVMREHQVTRPPKVLVVDDEALVRETVRRTLEASGYHVMEAANGLDGLAVLETALDVDLIVADLAMPELSGAEMVARIR